MSDIELEDEENIAQRLFRSGKVYDIDPYLNVPI